MDERGADGLSIAGLVPFSSSDWPGRLAATVFLQGCPWDCFYCHNPALIDPLAPGEVGWGEVVALLRRRAGLLDAAVFSGGEPTRQRGLVAAMREVRDLGFEVGLHTAGAHPALLDRALPHADWVGLDVKALPDDYARVTGRAAAGERAWRSLALVLAAHRDRAGTRHPLDYEVRTTVHPAAFDDEGVRRLGHRLADAGVETWSVQRFRDEGARHPLPRFDEADAGRLTLSTLPAERFIRLVVR